MDRANQALKLISEGKMNLGIVNENSLEIERLKIKNFRNNIIISLLTVVILSVLVF